jgi:hypothetical protein
MKGTEVELSKAQQEMVSEFQCPGCDGPRKTSP